MKVLVKLKKPHFEGQSNISKGGVRDKGKDLVELINDLNENANLVKLTSDVAGGGGATEDDLAVDGLLATDTILSVTQRVPGANDLALIGYADQKDGSIDAIWAADPGAGAILELLVVRALA